MAGTTFAPGRGREGRRGKGWNQKGVTGIATPPCCDVIACLLWLAERGFGEGGEWTGGGGG